MDLETSTIHNEWEFYEWEGENAEVRLKLGMEHRLYSLHEFKELINQSGWRYLKGVGRPDDSESELGPLTCDCKDMWVAARA